MEKILALTLILLAFFPGCKKSEPAPPLALPPAPKAPAPVSPPPIVEQPVPPTIAPAEPAPGPAGASVGAKTYEVPVDAFNTLREALVAFQGKNGRLPRDWAELTAAGFLRKMPPAPPGKRFTFDASTTVYMVDR